MTGAPDKRVHAWRADLAAASLKGIVDAGRYAEGVPRGIIAASAPIRTAPRGSAPLASEALFGETFTVFEERGGWAWGQLETDSYVGYLPAELIGPPPPIATHRVAALRSYLLAAPDIKASPLALLPMQARLTVDAVEGGFARLATGGHVHAGHLAAASEWDADPASVAARFVGTPYLWGGRTSLGLDCSALVQLSLAACGIACPRDSDMQAASLGDALPAGSEAGDLRRGDLVFWIGHVAIAADARTLIHANAHHMATAIEPLDVVLARITPVAGPVVAVRRPRLG